MPPASHLPAPTPRDNHRQVERRVLVAVAHPCAEDQHRMIEEATVPIGRSLEVLRQPCIQRYMVGVDLGVLGDIVRVVLMVRYDMMAFWHADFRICPETQLPVELKATHAGYITLKSQRHEVHQKFDVLVVAVRRAHWRPLGWQWPRRTRPRGPLDALLHFPNRFDIVVHHSPIADPEPLRETCHARRNRIEDAAVCLHLAEPSLDAPTVSKQALEHRPWILFVRHRRSRRPPGRAIEIC